MFIAISNVQLILFLLDTLVRQVPKLYRLNKSQLGGTHLEMFIVRPHENTVMQHEADN